MADNLRIFSPGFRVTDTNGNPVSGAKIKFWEGGTSTPKPVYSDPDLSTSLGSVVHTRSDGFPVASQGSSTTVLIYIGSGLFDIEITDANDVAIFPRKINQSGALNTSAFLTSADASTLSIPVASTAANLTLNANYNGKHVRGNTTSQSLTLTLGDAATLGDGWNVEISKAAAANELNLVTTSSQTINFNGQSHTGGIALTGIGEGVSIRCDGSAFYVASYTPPLMNAVGVIVIADRVSSAPSTPPPGARYIVTGAFSTFEVGDIIEADAASGFIEYTPPTDCGWIAYVQDENLNYQFQGSAWAELAHPASATLAGVIELATAAEIAAATDSTRALVASLLGNHPLVPKAWAVFAGSDATVSERSGASTPTVVRDAEGTYTVTWGVTFGSVNYVALAAILQAPGTTLHVRVTARTATTTTFIVETGAGADTDPTGLSVIAFGKLA